ncbi:MAG: hypothetical protein DK306_001625 [Chloroflexi bacterium]|nr:MAG: hypothetical protein DK306_001625 [Chloroflexota bacterium]
MSLPQHVTPSQVTDVAYLPPGLAQPSPAGDGLDAPYWGAALQNKLMVQQCNGCDRFLWGPEWVCHACHCFDLRWTEVEPRGRIYSWERVWHPVHPALTNGCPYVVVLVELPQAGDVRMVGNLLGEPIDRIEIGAEVEAVFEHHTDADPPFTLVQWRRAETD